MRWLALAAALLVSLPLCAQEKEVPKEKKAAAPKKKAVTGRKPQPSKEQIRKFNELEKKQQKKK